MRSYFSFTIIFLFALGIFLFQTPNVLAGEDHNIRGMAYTEEGDFIYFNCLDQPGDSFTYEFPFLLGGEPCEIEYEGKNEEIVTDYGVNLNYNTLVFSGHARHEKDGLIYFEHENGPPDYDFLSNCSYGDYQANQSDCQEENCTACYNIADERVYGYAYVANDDEWIALDVDGDINNSDRIGINNYTHSNPGDFFGFFYYNEWGDVDLNECYSDPVGCSPNNPNHKVYVGNLELAQMSAPHWGASEACSLTSSALGARLRWSVHGGSIAAYDIAISESNDFDSAEVFEFRTIFDMGNRFEHVVGDGVFDYDLNWNTSYYWWLRLKDGVDEEWTDWAQFNHDEVVDGVVGELSEDNIDINQLGGGDEYTFTTYQHPWPRPYFTWEGHPETEFLAGAPYRFEVTSETKYYTSPNNFINFGDNDFEAEFEWWGEIDGELSNEITIVDAAIFPDEIEPNFHLDANSIILEHNDNVSLWEDETGNYDVSANGDDRPQYHIDAINGRPAVYFDVDNFLENININIEQPFNIFVVSKSDDINNSFIIGNMYEDNVALGYDENQYLMFAGEALKGGSINNNLTLWRAFYSGESSSLKIIQEGEGNEDLFEIDLEEEEEFENDINGITIGELWEGYIGEIIIYNSPLNSNQRQEIKEYLKLKWALDGDDDPSSAKVDVYFESVDEDQVIWLRLTDPDTGYNCATSTPDLDVSFRLPLWREIRARENQ